MSLNIKNTPGLSFKSEIFKYLMKKAEIQKKNDCNRIQNKVEEILLLKLF